MKTALELADACRALTNMMVLVPGLDTVVCEAELRRQHAESQEMQQLAARGADGLMRASQTIAQLEREIEALRKEAEWQPIETAPKDGTRILIRDSDGQRQVAGFCRVLGCDFYAWVIANDMHIKADMATHWKPLPPPPKMGEKA